WLFDRGRRATRLGRQGRVHGADVAVLRARQYRRPPGLPVQLQRRAGDEGLKPLPGRDQGLVAAGLVRWRALAALEMAIVSAVWRSQNAEPRWKAGDSRQQNCRIRA